jgi:hypothetical protein
MSIPRIETSGRSSAKRELDAWGGNIAIAPKNSKLLIAIRIVDEKLMRFRGIACRNDAG